MISTILLICVSLISCAFGLPPGPPGTAPATKPGFESNGPGFESKNYKGTLEKTELNAVKEAIYIEASVSDSNDLVTITLTGPSTVYYSVAFDSCEMKNSFALIVPGTDETDDSVLEYKLGDDKKGDSLTTTFTTTSDSTEDDVRTVTLTRSLSVQDNLDSSYYAFSSDTDSLDVMWAFGSKSKYSQHEESAAGCVAVSFTTITESDHFTKEEAVHFSWGQLFGTDSSYFSGKNPVSLIVVLALLASIMVYAAFHCYSKTRSPGKVIVDETRPLIDDQEDGYRIV